MPTLFRKNLVSKLTVKCMLHVGLLLLVNFEVLTRHQLVAGGSGVFKSSMSCRNVTVLMHPGRLLVMIAIMQFVSRYVSHTQ
jgi:hypothetical protein